MKERFIENGIECVRDGDYYIPNLKVPEGKFNIGKYGRLHSIFIKENRTCLYSAKMLKGTWLAYLEEIDTTAKEMVDKLVKDMAVKQRHHEGIKSKRPNGLGWRNEWHKTFRRRNCITRICMFYEGTMK